MERSESIKELAAALAGFQGDISAVTKDGTNPFFKSKYATLENIWTCIREALSKHNLAVMQLPEGNTLTTVLMHNSGEFISGSMDLTMKDNTPQGQGSAITYARRYALSAILGLVSDEDDDGNAATHGSTAKKPKATTKVVPKADLDKAMKVIGDAKSEKELDIIEGRIKDSKLYNANEKEELHKAVAIHRSLMAGGTAQGGVKTEEAFAISDEEIAEATE